MDITAQSVRKHLREMGQEREDNGQTPTWIDAKATPEGCDELSRTAKSTCESRFNPKGPAIG